MTEDSFAKRVLSSLTDDELDKLIPGRTDRFIAVGALGRPDDELVLAIMARTLERLPLRGTAGQFEWVVQDVLEKLGYDADRDYIRRIVMPRIRHRLDHVADRLDAELQITWWLDEFREAAAAIDDRKLGTYEHEVTSGRALAAYENVKRLCAKYGFDVTESVEPDVLAVWDELAGLRRIEQEDRLAAERAERLARRAASRPPDAAMPGSRCRVDGCRKPARVDDLCKVHAREAGTLPHGKIGAA